MVSLQRSIHTLMWFRPGTYDEHVLCYHSAAEQIIDEIRTSDPSLPIAKGSTRQHAMARLKDKLGGLVHRPHPYDDWCKKDTPVHPS